MQSGLLLGPNFSGRTDRLLENVRSCASSRRAKGRGCEKVYISPTLAVNLSGLALSVRHEVQVHGSHTPFEIDDILGIETLENRLLWQLSGGELCRTILASALRLHPKLLAIDCALEELDAPTRRNVYRRLFESTSEEFSLLVADNRIRREDFRVPIHEFALDEKFVHLQPNSNRLPEMDLWLPPEQVELRDLHVDYGEGPVLKGVNLTLRPGSVYYLSGANGSGKSTLAKAMCGVLKPRTGRIEVNGKLIQPSIQGNRHIALHFQNPDIGRTETCADAEAMKLGNRISKLPADKRETLSAFVRQALGVDTTSELLGLPFVLRKRADLYSCLASGASLYFLDEPTLGQDDHFVASLARLIDRFRQANATFMIVSHENPLASLLPGETLEIVEGKVCPVPSKPASPASRPGDRLE
jgi:ABC-type Mn2+/Zn2+ transport system ATPase subunit